MSRPDYHTERLVPRSADEVVTDLSRLGRIRAVFESFRQALNDAGPAPGGLTGEMTDPLPPITPREK